MSVRLKSAFPSTEATTRAAPATCGRFAIVSGTKSVIGPSGVGYPVTPAVERFLRSVGSGALRSLVLEMASYSPEDAPTAHRAPATFDTALAGGDPGYFAPFDAEVDVGVQGVEEAFDEVSRPTHHVAGRVRQHPLTRIGDLPRDVENTDGLL